MRQKATRLLACLGGFLSAMSMLAIIMSGLAAQTAEANFIPPFLISPYYGTTTYSQGYSAEHQAYDFLLRYRSVLAADVGIIKKAYWYSNDSWCHQTITDTNRCGFGLHIRMSHPNGYWTIYGHLSTVGFDLTTTGIAPVNQGQFIGTSGHSGYSTGPHLHFEVRTSEFGASVDPMALNLWEDGQWVSPTLFLRQSIWANGQFILLRKQRRHLPWAMGGLLWRLAKTH